MTTSGLYARSSAQTCGPPTAQTSILWTTISGDWCMNRFAKYLSGMRLIYVSGWLRHDVTSSSARWIMQLTSGVEVWKHRVVTLNNLSDDACRIVDHTHSTSTGSCHSHPLVTGETVTSVNWTLWTLILLCTVGVRHLQYIIIITGGR